MYGDKDIKTIDKAIYIWSNKYNSYSLGKCNANNISLKVSPANFFHISDNSTEEEK